MSKMTMTDEMKKALLRFIDENRSAELVNTYLFFLEKKHHLNPVLFSKEKTIYKSTEDAIAELEKDGKIWHQTEIRIGVGQASVNEETKKIYICPFSGKVFGDNTHPNPQDAIYEWVAKCPENKERSGGLPVKRFFVSEDPELIKSYVEKNKIRKEPVKKVVYSSVVNGKLFQNKSALIEDFKLHYLKPISLVEVQNQNKYKIAEHLLTFLQTHLVEDKISGFVEMLSGVPQFLPYVERWVESED